MRKILFLLLLNITLVSDIYSQTASFCWKGEIYQYLAEQVGAQSSSCGCEQTGVFLNSFPSCINGFELEFEENFDGNSLDLTKWQIQPWGQGALQGSSIMEYNSLDNITVSNGTCKIIAKKETVTRRAVNWKGDTEILSDGQQNLRTYEYTSSNIWTNNNNKFFQGKYEVRCRMPGNSGFWPAFWTYGGTRWNEIDIFDNYDGITKFITSIQHDYDGDGSSEGCNHYYTGYDFSQWHTFTCIFDFDKITWFIDNNLVRTQYRILTSDGDPVLCGDDIASGTYFRSKSFPLEEMHIILNLAIKSGTNAPPASVFPSTFEIDYVRFYKRVQLPDCSTNSDLLIIGTDDGGTVTITTFPQVNYFPNATIAANTITTVGHVIPMPGQTWRAQVIELNPGFETIEGQTFVAESGDCQELFQRLGNPDTTKHKENNALDSLPQRELNVDEMTENSKETYTSEAITIDQETVIENKRPGSDSLKSAESYKSPIYISPNPSSDGKFSINCTVNGVGCMDAEIAIMNSLGQTIYTQPFSNFRFPAPLDLSTSPRGTYLIKIRNEDKIFVHKAVFQ